MNISKAMPKYRYKSVLDITVSDLNKMGVKAIGLDIDNTICFDGTTDFFDGLDAWLAELQNAGIKITIITNAMKKRAEKVANALGLPFVALARKPRCRKLYVAAKNMGVDITEMAMIGDQLFADVEAANRCGAVGIRVDPMEGETRFKYYYARRRRKEAPVLAEFEKNHGYGVDDNE